MSSTNVGDMKSLSCVVLVSNRSSLIPNITYVMTTYGEENVYRSDQRANMWG